MKKVTYFGQLNKLKRKHIRNSMIRKTPVDITSLRVVMREMDMTRRELYHNA